MGAKIGSRVWANPKNRSGGVAKAVEVQGADSVASKRRTRSTRYSRAVMAAWPPPCECPHIAKACDRAS